ncbi:MAG TPA: M1 family aminopeptidase [Terriglobales bacterium]|nr:M1 family aminopeptidase [Terriglobales bacterium]
MPKGKVTTVGKAALCWGLLTSPCHVHGQETPSAALALYRQLRSVGISAATTHQIRDAALDREDIHISLQDGAIAFTEAVDGHVTGAFFQGEGEVLLIPPDRAERASLALFTAFPVLEEKFSTAYFRFDDDTARELAPALRPPEDPAAFVERWGAVAKSLSEIDALRLLAAFTNTPAGSKPARFLHARFGGARLGTFDIFLDAGLPEQISVAQAGYTGQGQLFYDVWLSSLMRSRRGEPPASAASQPIEAFVIPEYKLAARVLPPHEMQVDGTLTVRCRQDGLRTLVFELSRYLRVSRVTLAGEPVTFIQNEAVPGSELERRGNDLVTVLLPAPLQAGQDAQLKFNYGGSVMSEAGGGLMYVGARGIWYPNRGPAMTNFDLEFRYPKGWTLLATGVLTASATEGDEQVAHWRSSRPIPLAGFNLGQYVASQAHAGDTLVSTYGARGVEQTLTGGAPLSPQQRPVWRRGYTLPTNVPPAAGAAPETHPAAVEQQAVAAINFLSQRLGSFPYPSLSLTQMPGSSSQGWPGLIFLSSYVFLPAGERPPVPPADLEYDRTLYDQLMTTHEVAHQWWGDGVLWKGYRDQWLMEALANYCALMQLEAADPERFRRTMERYRQHLLRKNPRGLSYSQAGAVTLGVRLSSSKFPDGYETVAYERGSWLMHMLRGLLGGDTERSAAQFFDILRRLQQRFAGQVISTLDFQHALEEELPESLRFEGRKSLEWFFDSWVNGVAIPRMVVRDVRFSARSKGLVASGTLIQQDAGRDLVTSVPIYARTLTSPQPVFAGRIFADGEETTFRLAVPAGAKELLVDPYNTILRQP